MINHMSFHGLRPILDAHFLPYVQGRQMSAYQQYTSRWQNPQMVLVGQQAIATAWFYSRLPPSRRTSKSSYLERSYFRCYFPYKSEVKPEVHMVFSKSSGSNVRRTVGMFVVRQRKM